MLQVACMALNELKVVQERIRLMAYVTDLPLLFTTAIRIWQIQLDFWLVSTFPDVGKQWVWVWHMRRKSMQRFKSAADLQICSHSSFGSISV